jgi:RimJ/RimL family protein N-acetyltransferase
MACIVNESLSDALTSPRLQLRRLRSSDADALCSYRSMPEVARYQYWETFEHDDAARLIETQLTAEPNIPGTWFQLAIVKTDSGCLIGDCGLHCPKAEPRQMEIGITVSPRFQGHRYADEAAECLLRYCFATLDKHRVFAYIDVLNRSAIALCLRMGFRQEAHLVEHRWFKNRWQSEYVFAMLKREWEMRLRERGNKFFDARRDSRK